jgi:hypothetical protein
MKKIASIAVAAVLAVASSVSLSSPSSAHSFGDPGAGLLGLGIGVAVGAAIAGGPNYVYNDGDFGRWRGYGGRWGYGDDYGWRRHIRDCFRTYPGYDPRTDSYPGHHGHWYRCRL